MIYRNIIHVFKLYVLNDSTEMCISNCQSTGALPVPELMVTGIWKDSIRVEWTPVLGVSYYTLQIREQLTARPLRPEVRSVYGEALDVTDLKSATSYCFSVSAVMDSLTSTPYSEPACATTGVSI